MTGGTKAFSEKHQLCMRCQPFAMPHVGTSVAEGSSDKSLSSMPLYCLNRQGSTIKAAA